MPGEYLKKRVEEAISQTQQAKSLMHALWGKTVETISKDRQLIEKQKALQQEILHVENELAQIIESEETISKFAESKEKLDGLINDLRERIARCTRELETIGRDTHAIHEKRETESTQLAQEEDKLKEVNTLIEKLDKLQHSFHRLLSGKELISGRNRPNVKI